MIRYEYYVDGQRYEHNRVNFEIVRQTGSYSWAEMKPNAIQWEDLSPFTMIPQVGQTLCWNAAHTGKVGSRFDGTGNHWYFYRHCDVLKYFRSSTIL